MRSSTLFIALSLMVPLSVQAGGGAVVRAGAGDAAESLRQRVEEVSARFLGTPYIHSPLGEGEGPDPDPLFRFDAVDCLTFVEETLALAASNTPADFPAILQSLRYGGQRPVYEDRNHLMEAQWIPNNERKGFVRDVTREIAGERAVAVQKVLTAKAWKSGSSRALHLPASAQLEGHFGLEIVPLERLASLAPQIPSGTILLVVREDRPGRVTRVTHLGFVVQKDGRTFLRHAARSRYARVVDEKLSDFLERNSKYSQWPVVGVSLFQPTRPAPGEGPG